MAQKQLGRYKSENGFQWVNMAPSGHRLNVDDLAKVVAEWFKKEPDNFERKDSSWMPQEWNGTHLHDLVSCVAIEKLFIISTSKKKKDLKKLCCCTNVTGAAFPESPQTEITIYHHNPTVGGSDN